MRCLVIAAVGIGLMSVSLGTVSAAQPNDRRRDFVDGVLRVLIETQVLPHLTRDGQPPHGRPPGGPPLPKPPGDPRSRDDRIALEEFAMHSGELVSILRQEVGVRPELRPLLGDAIAVKAMTDGLVQRVEAQPDPALLADGFVVVDRHSRTLATRLEGSFAVSATCRECVRKLNASRARLCQRLAISPQVDQEQVVQLFGTLTGHLRGLLDNVAGSLQRSRDSQVLLIDGKRLQMQVNFLTTSVSRPVPYEELLHQYRTVHKDWRALADRLRSLDSRDSERHIRRINHVHRQLHEVLWIPYEMDRGGLARCAAALSRNVDAACERVSLKMLLATPDAAGAVEVARELRSMCADFSKAAAGQDPLDSLRWDFRPLDVQWQQFRTGFQGLAAPELAQQLAETDENIQAVQELLGIAPLIDVEQAVELSGEVDSLTDLLFRDLAERLGPSSRYPPQFRREAAAAAEALHESAHQLHDDLLRRPHSESVRKKSEGLSVAWESLQQYVGKLEHRDRAVVTRNYERLAPAMARLQMMFVF